MKTRLDPFSPEERAEVMRAVRSQNTTPELSVRSLLHQLGFRFRVHRSDLPGRPDIILPRYRTVIFVHGCFWHRHPGCVRASTPATRQDYWLPKFARTVARDQCNQLSLRDLGWNVVVVWECEVRSLSEKPETITRQIISGSQGLYTPPKDVRVAAEERPKYGG